MQFSLEENIKMLEPIKELISDIEKENKGIEEHLKQT